MLTAASLFSRKLLTSNGERVFTNSNALGEPGKGGFERGTREPLLGLVGGRREGREECAGSEPDGGAFQISASAL
jgi:hypothetical protein